MVKIEELRLNNWILDRGNPVQVNMLSLGGISFHTINGVNVSKSTGLVIDTEEDRFDGIELTSEIMEACRFVYNAECSKGWLSPEINGFRIRIQDDDDGFLYAVNAVWSKRLLFLHELQNIFLDIMEKPLSIHLHAEVK